MKIMGLIGVLVERIVIYSIHKLILFRPIKSNNFEFLNNFV